MNAARGWPPPPWGALGAAIDATQRGDWGRAIALWRDQLRRDPDDRVAAARLKEAADAMGHDGLAAQMAIRVGDLSDELYNKHAAGPDRVRPDPRWQIGSFKRRAEGIAIAMDTAKAQGANAVRQAVSALLAARGAGREALHWAILALDDVGVTFDDELMRQCLRRFDEIAMRGEGEAMAEARLYRGLGFPAFAQMLLEEALARSGGRRERGAVRRRLARIAAERDRWGEVADLVAPEDFPTAADRGAFEAVATLPRPTPGSAAAEPLAVAFEWLQTQRVEQYTPANRLLMVGNTLACGGMERVLANSYRHFSGGGAFDAIDLALLGFRDGAASAFYADQARVCEADIISLGKTGKAAMPFMLLPGSWKQRAEKLYAHIAATRPRAIHAWNDLTGLLAAFAGIAAGCPRTIVNFHHGPAVPLSGRAETIAAYPHVYRALIERPEIVPVFCAHAAARDYARWWDVAPEMLRVLHNGFEADEVTPSWGRREARKMLSLPGDAPVIGWVGRFGTVKQPLVWADAAIALASRLPEAHFLLVGDGPLRETIEQSFAEHGVGDRVHFTGRVTNVADHLAAMDAIWQTSASEGLPNVLIEAQFAGVPALAFDVGGVSETFADGESGWLVPSGDVAALVDRTAELLADPARLVAASEAAGHHAAAHFGADRFYDGLTDLYG